MGPGASQLRHGAAKTLAMARLLGGLGPRRAVAVVANSLRQPPAADRRIWPSDAVTRDPGLLQSVEPVTVLRADRAGRRRRAVVGARLEFAGAELELRFVTEDMVRVSWGPDAPPVAWALDPAAGGVLGPIDAGDPDGGPHPGAGDPDGGPHPGAGAPRTAAPAEEHPGLVPPRSVRVSGDPASGVLVRTASMEVAVGVDGTLRYRLASGALVRQEPPPLRRGTARIHRSVLRRGEKVAGLGEQAGGVALEGPHRLWNRDPGGRWAPGTDPLYCAIPVLLGLHAGGDVLAFYENPAEGAVVVRAPTATASGQVEVRFSSGMLRHYVAAAPVPTLLERYAALTGRPPLPPRWALGYHQSRWGYARAAEVAAVAEGFADEGLPLSAVHLDIDHMDGYRVFTVDPDRFGDLAELTGDLGRRGTRAVAIVDPAVKADPGYDVYATGAAEGHFVTGPDGAPLLGVVWPGDAAFPDFTDPGTRRWWGGWYHRLIDAGVAGVWHDMNEPTSMALWGDQTLPRTARHAAEGHGADHRQCHNIYGLCMDHAGASALAAERPGRRPFVLSRAGWAGIQRLAWTWTGDADTSWASLAQQVRTVVGLGLSGVAFSGSDTGGFAGAPSTELYLRWLELSVLTGLCRTHSSAGVPGREPWRFEEPARSAIGDLVRFRYRLLPYLYTLAAEAAALGHPLVRPLWWPAAAAPARGRQTGDPSAAPWTDDAFLLGDAVLVAPVLAPGVRRRAVALPAGRWLRWRPLGPGAAAPGLPGADPVTPITAGDRRALLDAPLGSAPLAVRAGSVLPLDDGWARGAGPADPALDEGHRPRLLAFHCFPDAEGRARGTCYDDAGDGYGPQRLDRLELAPGAGGLRTLRWTSEGDWPRPARVRVVVHAKAAVTVSADGTAVAFEVARHGPSVATVVECGPFETLVLS